MGGISGHCACEIHLMWLNIKSRKKKNCHSNQPETWPGTCLKKKNHNGFWSYWKFLVFQYVGFNKEQTDYILPGIYWPWLRPHKQQLELKRGRDLWCIRGHNCRYRQLLLQLPRLLQRAERSDRQWQRRRQQQQDTPPKEYRKEKSYRV